MCTSAFQMELAGLPLPPPRGVGYCPTIHPIPGMVKDFGYNNRMLRVSIIVLLLSLLTSCSFFKSTPDPNLAVQQSVAQTLAALPPTATSVPLPTPYPSPTPMTLAGLFCEYQFCIGHPSSMAFYDHLAAQNPLTPST